MSEVTVYHSPGCPPCKKAMEYLNTKKVQFISKDIAEHEEYRNELMELGSMGTPTLKIGEDIIIGFNPSKIDAALAKMS